MARPVVASPQAAEGIDAVAGRDLLVAGTDGDEAAAVLDLLADRDAAGCLGRAARTRVEARYSWDATLAMLPDIVRGVEQPIQKKRQSA